MHHLKTKGNKEMITGLIHIFLNSGFKSDIYLLYAVFVRFNVDKESSQEHAQNNKGQQKKQNPGNKILICAFPLSEIIFDLKLLHFIKTSF